MRKSCTRKEKAQSKEDPWEVDNSVDEHRIEPPNSLEKNTNKSIHNTLGLVTLNVLNVSVIDM